MPKRVFVTFMAAPPATQSSRSRRAGSSFPAAAATVSPSTKSTGARTYMRMGTGGIGLGIGGQRYSLVMLFETADRLDKFVAGGWDSRATAEAAAGKEGVAVQSSFFDGVAFYQITDKGLMALGRRHRHEVLGQRRAALARNPWHESGGHPAARCVS